MSIVSGILDKYGIQNSLAQADEFEKFVVQKLWNEYTEDCMAKRLVIENQIRDLGIKFPNGTVKKAYSASVKVPKELASEIQFEGLEELGLTLKAEDDNYTIEGTPIQHGDFSLKMKYKYNGWIEGVELSELVIPIAFNPDPRTLWKNIPTNKDIPYYKEDMECAYVKVEAGKDGTPRKDMVAASVRGRSHAQEGKPRDDHYRLYHCDATDWYVIAVADGAGSAKYSRKGSWIACDTVVGYCKEKLQDATEFEAKIKEYKNAENEEEARKIVGNEVYSIIGNAAFMAHKAINDAAKANEGSQAKDFATTLMFAICRKFDFDWFIASYWVGDGAMCLLNEDKKEFKLLGIPDEGEFSGQTRFLTMPEMFKDANAVYSRLRFSIVEDFTALILMTDGVSDPMFETDNNLNSYDKWAEFWNKIKTGFPEDEIEGVDLSDDNEESKNQLLNWMNFWSPGNHDDRTMAILY